jgi:hypothetical protein
MRVNKRAQQLHLDPVTTKLTCENYKQRAHQVRPTCRTLKKTKQVASLQYFQIKACKVPLRAEKKMAPFSPQLKLFWEQCDRD